MGKAFFVTALLLVLPAMALAQGDLENLVKNMQVPEDTNGSVTSGILGQLRGMELPSSLGMVFGNERINVKLKDGTVVGGIVTKNGKVTDISIGPLSDPSLELKIKNPYALAWIFTAPNPQKAYMEAETVGDLSLEGVGFFNQARVFFIKLAMTVMNFFSWS